MAVRTLQVLQPTLLTTAALTTVYTVPTGRTLIIKEITVVNGGGVARTWGLANLRSGAAWYWVYLEPISPNISTRRQMETVVPEGEVIQAIASLANILTISISGSLLLGASS